MKVWLVQEGETLRSIAERALGDGSRWKLLAYANRLNFESIEVAEGREIKIPAGIDGCSIISRVFTREEIAREIEQYGEGLIPDLRVVCSWLATHLLTDEDIGNL